MIHFVGFRGEEYWSAVSVWGKPDFYHRGYDNRMRREIADGDTVVFANGCEEMGPNWYSYPDVMLDSFGDDLRHIVEQHQ